MLLVFINRTKYLYANLLRINNNKYDLRLAFVKIMVNQLAAAQCIAIVGFDLSAIILILCT